MDTRGLVKFKSLEENIVCSTNSPSSVKLFRKLILHSAVKKYRSLLIRVYLFILWLLIKILQ